MWDLVVFAARIRCRDAGICRVSYLRRRLRVRKALTPASLHPSANPWSSPARSYMFCVSMLISSYVLRRLTYFSVFLTRKSGLARISAVKSNFGGRATHGRHGGALPVRPQPACPARARTPRLRDAQTAPPAHPSRLSCLSLLCASSDLGPSAEGADGL